MQTSPKPGSLSGTVTRHRDLVELYAMDRSTLKQYKPARFDKSTGRFQFEGLPGDATIDIGVKLSSGRTIEGIDLSQLDRRLLELAARRREHLGLPPEPAHQFTQADVQELIKFTQDLAPDDFMDRSRVLYLAGHGRRATMLLELMRTRAFHDQKKGPDGAQLIWRIELWYFDYRNGGWEKTANQERVLRRERLSPLKWREISVEYLPSWSVYIKPDGGANSVELTIPDTIDPATGRPAASSPELKTQAILSGLAVPSATQPSDRQSAPDKP